MKISALLSEFSIGSFNHEYKIAIGEITPSLLNTEGFTQTDLFCSVSPEIQKAALDQYTRVRIFQATQFRLFIEEQCDVPFERVLTLADEEKIRMMDLFQIHGKTKSWINVLESDSFNPLYFTGYSDGLAVMFAQNPDNLRAKVVGYSTRILAGINMHISTFLSASFEDQEKIYTFLQEVLEAEQQALDWIWSNS